MLTKEPEMLQTEVLKPMRFATITMQQNATAVGLRSKQCCRGSYSEASPDPVAGFKGSLCSVEGRGQGRRGEGLEGRRSSGDADSDAKLLPNRLNRKPIGDGGVEP